MLNFEHQKVKDSADNNVAYQKIILKIIKTLKASKT